MSVGLAIIARDEQDSLPNLLASVAGAFDQIVLLDTGCVDDTVSVFSKWAREERKRTAETRAAVSTTDGEAAPFYKVRKFEWCMDFGAARNEAHSYLDTDWQVWADADDLIAGAQNIRTLCDQAPMHLHGYVAGYNYAQVNGKCVCYLKRERIVRRGVTEWAGRVHEAQAIMGPVQWVEPSVVEWIHNKAHDDAMKQGEARRNLEILEHWIEDEPNNTRILAYLGSENAARGEHELAMDFYNRYLALNPDWQEEQAQVCRKAAGSLFALDRPKEARDMAFRAIELFPSWPDSYLTLAEYHLRSSEPAKTLHWAQQAEAIGVPNTVLIVNPLDYSWLPLKFKAMALLELGQFHDANVIAMRAIELFPFDDSLRQVQGIAYENAKREQTADTFVKVAQQLIAHDEQEKAMALLETTVPHFARYHPKVVQLRSELRERLMWVYDPEAFKEHYTTGGSKPEDFLPEERVDEVCEILPRVGFLLGGLQEQLEVMA